MLIVCQWLKADVDEMRNNLIIRWYRWYDDGYAFPPARRLSSFLNAFCSTTTSVFVNDVQSRCSILSPLEFLCTYIIHAFFFSFTQNSYKLYLVKRYQRNFKSFSKRQCHHLSEISFKINEIKKVIMLGNVLLCTQLQRLQD